MSSKACRGCQALVTWALTRESRWMPVDPEPAGDGNVRLEDGDPPRATVLTRLGADLARVNGERLHRSHLSTCPNARTYRRRR